LQTAAAKPETPSKSLNGVETRTTIASPQNPVFMTFSTSDFNLDQKVSRWQQRTELRVAPSKTKWPE
jgi:hypothetical protein